MIDLTKPSGIIFLLIAFISGVGALYSIIEFILWQIRHLKNEDFDLPPFAVVGAIIIGVLIVSGLSYSILYIWGTRLAYAISEVVKQINLGSQS